MRKKQVRGCVCLLTELRQPVEQLTQPEQSHLRWPVLHHPAQLEQLDAHVPGTFEFSDNHWRGGGSHRLLYPLLISDIRVRVACLPVPVDCAHGEFY